MAYSSTFKFFLTGNLYEVDTKLDDWAKNAIKNPNIEIKAINEYKVLADGKIVWVANSWYGFCVKAYKYIPIVRVGRENFLGKYYFSSNYAKRPSFWVALRLWWKIKKHIRKSN